MLNPAAADAEDGGRYDGGAERATTPSPNRCSDGPTTTPSCRWGQSRTRLALSLTKQKAQSTRHRDPLIGFATRTGGRIWQRRPIAFVSAPVAPSPDCRAWIGLYGVVFGQPPQPQPEAPERSLCPLSDEQTRKSIEAFSKLASFMTTSRAASTATAVSTRHRRRWTRIGPAGNSSLVVRTRRGNKLASSSRVARVKRAR